MKSLNLKNVAAIATGVAMVGSVMAPTVAAGVEVREGTNDFVQLVKENPEDTYVIVGSLADASDAIAASELVASIRDVTAEETTVGVGGGAGKVTVQTSDDEGVTLSDNRYDIEYTNTGGSSSALAPTGFTAWKGVKGTTVTPQVLSDVLSEGTVEAHVDSVYEEFDYEEQIRIGNETEIRYHESESPTGHGLYLYAPASNPLGNISDKIVYRLSFESGNGLPLNNTTYDRTPVITVLQKEYAVDIIEAENGNFVLYPGEAVKMTSGETYTTDDGYIITLEGVGLQGSNTGAAQADVKIESPDGTIKRTTLYEKVGSEFFGRKISIYVDSMTAQGYTSTGEVTGRIDVRVGSGKLYFNEGSAFPLDDLWTVEAVSTAVTSETNYLEYVDVSYGNSKKSTAAEQGNFQGNEYSGLNEDVILDGPKNYDGTPVFNIRLSGYGGSSKVDTTDVVVKGSGSTESEAGAFGLYDAVDHNAVMHVNYDDRAGMRNKFEPASRQSIATPITNNGAAAGTTGAFGDSETQAADVGVWANSGGAPVGEALAEENMGYGANFSTAHPWGFVGSDTASDTYLNMHVIYFDRIDHPGGDDYRPIFRIGGSDGEEVRGSKTNETGTGTFTFQDVVDEVECGFILDGEGNVEIGHPSTAAGVVTTSCVVQPTHVAVGSDLTMDRALTSGVRGAPGMNIQGAGGNFYTAGDVPATILDDDATGETGVYPFVQVFQNPGTKNDDFSVVFDYSTQANYYNSTVTDHKYTGLVVLNATAGGAGTIIGGFNGGNEELINTATDNIQEPEVYHVTPTGTQLETDKASGARELRLTIPEQERNALLTVAETLSQDEDGGTTTYEVGDVMQDGSIVTDVGDSGSATVVEYANVPTPELDSNAKGTYQIAVGGPWVNTVSQGIEGNADTAMSAGTGYLMVDGNKMLAAGMTGQDTVEAVNKLIDLLETVEVEDTEEE